MFGFNPCFGKKKEQPPIYDCLEIGLPKGRGTVGIQMVRFSGRMKQSIKSWVTCTHAHTHTHTDSTHNI